MASFQANALPTPRLLDRSLIERRTLSARGQLRQPARSQPSTPSIPLSSQPCLPLALGPRPSQPVPPAVPLARPVSAAGLSSPRSSGLTVARSAARPATAAPVTAVQPVTPVVPSIVAQPATARERTTTVHRTPTAAHLPVSGILLEHAQRRGLLPTPRAPSSNMPSVVAEGVVEPDIDAGTEEWSGQECNALPSPELDLHALKIQSRIEASEMEQRRQHKRLTFQKTYMQALRRDLKAIVGQAEDYTDGSEIAARIDAIAEQIGLVQDSIAVCDSLHVHVTLMVVVMISQSILSTCTGVDAPVTATTDRQCRRNRVRFKSRQSRAHKRAADVSGIDATV
jgi:hypothetical protein